MAGGVEGWDNKVKEKNNDERDRGSKLQRGRMTNVEKT